MFNEVGTLINRKFFSDLWESVKKKKNRMDVSDYFRLFMLSKN